MSRNRRPGPPSEIRERVAEHLARVAPHALARAQVWDADDGTTIVTDNEVEQLRADEVRAIDHRAQPVMMRLSEIECELHNSGVACHVGDTGGEHELELVITGERPEPQPIRPGLPVDPGPPDEPGPPEVTPGPPTGSGGP